MNTNSQLSLTFTQTTWQFSLLPNHYEQPRHVAERIEDICSSVLGFYVRDSLAAYLDGCAVSAPAICADISSASTQYLQV